MERKNAWVKYPEGEKRQKVYERNFLLYEPTTKILIRTLYRVLFNLYEKEVKMYNEKLFNFQWCEYIKRFKFTH